MVLAGRAFRTLLMIALVCLTGLTWAGINQEIVRFFAEKRTYGDTSSRLELTIQVQPEQGNYRLIINLQTNASSPGASASGSLPDNHQENILVNGDGQIISGDISHNGETFQLAMQGHDQVAVAGVLFVPVNTFHPIALAMAQAQGNNAATAAVPTQFLDSFAHQPAVFQGKPSMQLFKGKASAGRPLSLSCNGHSVTSAPSNRYDYDFNTGGLPESANQYRVKIKHQSRRCRLECSTVHAAQILTTLTIGGHSFELQADVASDTSQFWLMLLLFSISANGQCQ